MRHEFRPVDFSAQLQCTFFSDRIPGHVLAVKEAVTLNPLWNCKPSLFFPGLNRIFTDCDNT